MVNQRSYAQVLRDGKFVFKHKEGIPKQMLSASATDDLKTASCDSSQYNGCALSKCIHFKNTPTHFTDSHKNLGRHHNPLYKENQIMQEPMLQTSNRFDILASIGDLDNDNYKEVTYNNLDQRFRGNKNKMGPILGRICHRKILLWTFQNFWKAIKAKLRINWVMPLRNLIMTLTILRRQVYNPGAIKWELGQNWLFCLVMITIMLCK